MTNDRPDIFTVVLTGGIASGKSAAADRFAELGATVVDTDRISHEIVMPGGPALEDIVREFGPDFLDASGNLDRAKMRSLIFDDRDSKLRLEAILHPRIALEAKARICASTGPYCVLVVPLYAETARWPWIHRVLVVDVDEATQMERVMARDGIDREQAASILRSQARRADRLALADDVLDNSGSLEGLNAQVAVLHEKYLRLAASRELTST